jgi:hypothetical protein
MRRGAGGHDQRVHPAAVLLTLLGLAVLLTAGLFFLESGPARGAPTPSDPSTAIPVGPAQAPGGTVPEPRDEFEQQAALPAVQPAPDENEAEVEPAAADDHDTPPRAETALLFRVVDGGNGEPLETFEARLGQHFLRPLLDEKGHNRHYFPGGAARFTGLIESRAGESVTLALVAHGFEELRLPDLYVPPGRELDLGTLRLARAPRLGVRVLDDRTGAPVAGARVVLLAQGASLEPDSRPVSSDALDPFRARTDGDGRALLTSRPGEPGTLAVRHPDYAAFDAALQLPLSEEYEQTVRLLAPARD